MDGDGDGLSMEATAAAAAWGGSALCSGVARSSVSRAPAPAGRALTRRPTVLQQAQGILRKGYTMKLPTAEVKKVAKKFAVPRALGWFAVVLLVGGAVFSALERGAEEESRRSLAAFLQRMRLALSDDDFHDLVAVVGKVNDRVAEEMVRANLTSAGPLPPVFAPHDWDFTGACFFCFTAATTIGYGNYTPTTSGGKWFLVVYALVAIPACANAFVEISDKALEALAKRMQKRMAFDNRITQAFRMCARVTSNRSAAPANPAHTQAHPFQEYARAMPGLMPTIRASSTATRCVAQCVSSAIGLDTELTLSLSLTLTLTLTLTQT